MTTENSRIYFYQGHTLIDITNTGVTRYTPEVEKQRNQQRNWETVLQLIGMRSQLLVIEHDPAVEANISKYEFGNAYTGKQRIWTFRFGVEFRDLYTIDKNPVGILVKDFVQTPVILNLDETAKPNLPLFYTLGDNKNIYFKKLKD